MKNTDTKLSFSRKQIIMIVSICILSIFAVFSVVYACNYYRILQASSEEVSTIGTNENQNSENNEIVPAENEEVVLEELQEESEEEKKELEKIDQNTLPYYIKVNYGAQVVNVYGKDSNGNYTVPVKAFVCSTGVATPKSGVYPIPNRFRWLRMQGYVYAQYVTQIKGNILFHSVPYLKKDNSTLEYWAYDKLGKYASAGCIRLTTADAIWIYNNCPTGTKVEFYSSSNPGPLGKPSAMKISNYPEPYRNWDPTDPDPNNPWRHYNGETIENTTPVEEPITEPEQPVTPTPEPTPEPEPEPTPEPEPEPTPEPEPEPDPDPDPNENTSTNENVNNTNTSTGESDNTNNISSNVIF